MSNGVDEDKLIMSEEGLNKLKEELKYLQGPKRKEIAQRIKKARQMGDISENAEYEEAKNEQAFIEGRVEELREMIRKAEVIDEDEIDTTQVSIGTRVKLLDKELEEKVEYKIVSSAESNPDENKISNESPIGEGLLGHQVGETVEIEVPAGTVEYEVLAIKK